MIIRPKSYYTEVSIIISNLVLKIVLKYICKCYASHLVLKYGKES